MARFRPDERTRCWWVVVAMAMVLLPVTIDSFGLVVALPSIGSTFNATTSELAWVLNMAVVFFGAGAMVLGRLSDIVGRRLVLFAAMGVLAVSSILCALSPSVGWLIGFRALEGIGMSGAYAASFPIVNHTFAPARRPVGLGLWAAGFMLGNVVGGPLAGWLCQTLSWRWLFWINLPLLAAALVVILVAVPESRDPGASRHIDWFGVVTPVLGLLCLLFALQSVNELGWSSTPVLAALSSAAVLITLFALVEPRRADPLIDFGLFASRSYVSASGVAFTGNFVFAGLLFLTPLYLQVALGYVPAHAGLVLLAFSIPCFAVSVFAGALCNRFGVRVAMLGGMVLLTIGCATYALVDTSTGAALVVVAMVLGGLGTGSAFNGSNVAGVGAIDEQRAGAASGVLGQIRLLGQSLGVTVTLVTLDVRAEQRLNDLLPGASLSPSQVHDVHGLMAGSEAARDAVSHDAPSIAHNIDAVVSNVFATGLRAALVVCACVGLVGVLSAAVTPRGTSGVVGDAALAVDANA